jgi:hypothetical protein
MSPNTGFRRFFSLQLFALPLLITLYAVVMLTASLLNSMGDKSGAFVLQWFATILAMLFGASCITLLFLLGWDRLQSWNDDS